MLWPPTPGSYQSVTNSEPSGATHTSAGRIPTDAGYRYFVDEWIGRSRLSALETRRIESFFIDADYRLKSDTGADAAGDAHHNH